jgi:polysaccharide biosynthesis/export protein
MRRILFYVAGPGTRAATLWTSVALLFVFLGVCPRLSAQQPDSTKRRPDSELTVTSQQPGPSELERENQAYVAASAVQIQEVLIKDPGILVELKRYIAKEATDAGQIVEESDLSNQVIFDRLKSDVRFRGVATRLLQRYGYLIASPNPDSTLGKEEELLLKERVRRLVQIEAQEDSEALIKRGRESQIDQTSACDPRGTEDCLNRSATGSRRRTDDRSNQNNQNQNQNDRDVTPVRPPPANEQTPQYPGGSVVQTAMNPIDGQRTDGLATNRRNSEMDPNSAQRAQEEIPGGYSSYDRSAPLTDGTSRRGGGSADESMDGRNTAGKNDRAQQNQMQDYRPGFREEEFTPVTLVHKPSPFADIPSLYDMYVQAAPRQKPERFGLEIFRNGTRASNVIPMDLPAGPEYIVGPGDGLAVDIWGGLSQRVVRVVDRQGRISLPEIGPLLVSGRSLGEVQEAVQRAMRTEFKDVSADVSLSRLRTVRVYVVGDVAAPGAYDISSLSTPLSAIFMAEGVTPRGSLRKLKHYHGKQLVQEVDAYDLLLHGMQSELRNLDNGDTILVPPLGPQVTVDGMVRRPAIYELNNEKTLADVLDLAGGILPSAMVTHVEVQRLEVHTKRTMLSLTTTPGDSPDVILAKLKEFQIADGDEVHIFPIAPYNEDAIYLQGHVLRPGRYAYRQDMKVTDIVATYKDVLPVPAPHYAEIIRLNAPDNHPSVESFDLSAAIENPATAPKLKPMDTVRIFSKYDFEPAPTVWVGGEVRKPGRYNTSGQAHLRDAIYLAGGAAPDAAIDSAQLFRTQSDGSLKILSVNLGEALAGNPIDNILLQPRDRLLIHRNVAKVDPATVLIKGEVGKPGRYPLTTNMSVQDLVRVAGGLKRSAETTSADLMRYPETTQGQIGSDFVTVNLAAAVSGDSNANLPLHDGDVLTIKPIAGWNDIGASVILRGELMHPGTYGIKPGEHLSTALQRAGGFTAEAYPYGAVLMRQEVREIEVKSHNELILRVKAERTRLESLPDGTQDQKNAKLTAVAQTDVTLSQLISSEPIGRVVIHMPTGSTDWKGTPTDVVLRNGDVLVVPKKANFVMVNGQVFNPTAISYRPGFSAKWYLSQAGGLTPMADKKGVFVIRADGSVIASKNNGSGWWSGDPLNTTLRAGDTVVVPEKPPKIGGPNWVTIMQAASVASSVALAVAYIH